MSAPLQFPSKETIISFLTHHPYTKNPLLVEKKIIEAVANFFANKKKSPNIVEQDVRLAITNTNEELLDYQMLIAFALMECAQVFKAKL